MFNAAADVKDDTFSDASKQRDDFYINKWQCTMNPSALGSCRCQRLMSAHRSPAENQEGVRVPGQSSSEEECSEKDSHLWSPSKTTERAVLTQET